MRERELLKADLTDPMCVVIFRCNGFVCFFFFLVTSDVRVGYKSLSERFIFIAVHMS